MDALTLSSTLELARARGGSRVTIYMPTRPFGPGSQEEDTTRLKNLLRTASAKLTGAGLKPAQADALLAPARTLTEDRPFWLRSDNGLALLLGPEGMHTFRVHVPLEEMVLVGDRYHVRQLLPFVESSAFWLLALSQKRIRLYEGSRSGLVEVPAEGAPESLAEAMRWDDFEKSSLQFHTGSSGTGGRRPAVFHGTGETEVKDELVRYFRAIDQGLHDHLRESHSPLILAGVDYLLPIYREVNTYPHLAADAVTGNPDSLLPQTLHAHALEVMAALAEAERRRVADLAEESWGSAKTTPDPETIVIAAGHGRVETLLLGEAARWWGTCDDEAGTVTLHETPLADDEDLLDVAALQTLEHGGAVINLAPSEMPHAEAAVALLRY